jgi:hypothetical protein
MLHQLLKKNTFKYQTEEQYWSTRLKEKWLKEGDLNTAYYHKSATNIRNKNFLLQINADGQLINEISLRSRQLRALGFILNWKNIES